MHCGRCQISPVVIKAFVFLLCNYGQAILLGCASVASQPINFMFAVKKIEEKKKKKNQKTA